MDGVHFVPAAFLGCLWCFARVFIRSPLGRKRWNVFGAYDVVTGQLTTVTNDGYMNAMTVCDCLVCVETDDKTELETLMTTNFQNLNNSMLLALLSIHKFYRRKTDIGEFVQIG